MADQVLLEFAEENWRVVGSFVGDTIILNKSVRGKGLAVELFLRCMEHREACRSRRVSRRAVINSSYERTVSRLRKPLNMD